MGKGVEGARCPFPWPRTRHDWESGGPWMEGRKGTRVASVMSSHADPSPGFGSWDPTPPTRGSGAVGAASMLDEPAQPPCALIASSPVSLLVKPERPGTSPSLRLVIFSQGRHLRGPELGWAGWRGRAPAACPRTRWAPAGPRLAGRGSVPAWPLLGPWVPVLGYASSPLRPPRPPRGVICPVACPWGSSVPSPTRLGGFPVWEGAGGTSAGR